jgi:hypothetical protein
LDNHNAGDIGDNLDGDDNINTTTTTTTSTTTTTTTTTDGKRTFENTALFQFFLFEMQVGKAAAIRVSLNIQKLAHSVAAKFSVFLRLGDLCNKIEWWAIDSRRQGEAAVP